MVSLCVCAPRLYIPGPLTIARRSRRTVSSPTGTVRGFTVPLQVRLRHHTGHARKTYRQHQSSEWAGDNLRQDVILALTTSTLAPQVYTQRAAMRPLGISECPVASEGRFDTKQLSNFVPSTSCSARNSYDPGRYRPRARPTNLQIGPGRLLCWVPRDGIGSEAARGDQLAREGVQEGLEAADSG